VSCYKSGGCGPYEMYSCNNCPASKPSYLDNNRKVNKVESKRTGNEFFDLIDNPMMKTENVIRFSGTYQIHEEQLSTHIVDVQFISFMIARKIISFGERVDVGLVLQRGLVHDVDEVLVGDIPRLTKYSSATCHDALNLVAASVVHDISNKLDGTDYVFDLWDNAKDNTIEGYIIRLADMLSVAKKTAYEVSILNNNNFLRIAVEMMNYIHDLYNSVPVDLFFIPSSIEYVKNLLLGVESYLSSIVEDRKDIVKQFNIEDTATSFIIKNRYIEQR